MWNGIECFYKISIYDINLFPLSNCVVQSSVIFNSCRTVDLPLIKPHCLVLKYELSKKFHNMISNYGFHYFTYNTS